MKKGSPVSIFLFFLWFSQRLSVGIFSVLKRFPEYLVRLSGSQQRSELYLLLLGVCGMTGSCAGFAGKMETWCLEPWAERVGWLSGKGREFLFPKILNDCVHCAS